MASDGEVLLSLSDYRVNFPTARGDVQAVRGIDLEVRRGEMLAVVGESGSGKSVTFLGLMGLLPPSTKISGSAKLLGTELVGANTKKVRRMCGNDIAMIFQDPLSALNPVQRIVVQITEMLQSHQEISKADAMKRTVELLDMVGIPQPDERAKQYPHEFSGGMRQRVMIAMAIANNPKVLIADEPTTALDVTVQAQILELLQQVQKELGAAVVLITHDLGVVARVADRVQVMYAGRVVERGELMPLFDHPSHPYTRGLMASLPMEDGQRLKPIQGAPPNMLQPPKGCAFHARCDFATEACTGDIPELRPFGDLETACVRVNELSEVPS